MTASERRINEYANSMFRYERLPEAWIVSCTKYLRALFGETLQGKTVIDYGFGRGNWSLAFRAVGASKVIAIDASSAAVTRFSEYCRTRGIGSIEVVESNILEEDITTTADLIWVYGILPHLVDQATFLTRLRGLAAGPATQMYVYHHNARSLREFTVETCRSVLTYQSEAEFREDSALFIRPARVRARDDLAAPHLKFATASDLGDLVRSCGIYVTRQDRDFQHFLLGKTPEDFNPHQFLCGLQAKDQVEIIEPPVSYAAEVDLLREIATDLLALPLSHGEKKRIAIGLFNTHFAFMRDGVHARDSLIEICLFLLYALLHHEVADRDLGVRSVRYFDLFRAALEGAARSERLHLLSGAADDNALAEYLVSANLRV
jgi:hypothetical protein